MNGLTFGAAALAEVRRVPLITTLTGNVVVERLTAGGKLGRGKLALLGRASHAVVAVSRSVYRTAARAGIPEAKLRTVPNGVDTSYFCPPDGEARCHARAELGYEPDDFVFCWVGRLDPIKGLSQLLDAWGRVEHLRPRARLLIVGDGEDRSTAEELVRRYPRSVRRLSFQENVRPVYHASDAFLMTSFSEGLSCTLLEAMASGLPVVVSALEENLEVGGGAEFMTTFPSRSPAALEHALLSMIDSRDRGPGLGLEARRRAEDFSLEVTARLWAELYRQLG
jgi:glycosyltransferase involved in cell wall biosynthesis